MTITAGLPAALEDASEAERKHLSGETTGLRRSRPIGLETWSHGTADWKGDEKRPLGTEQEEPGNHGKTKPVYHRRSDMESSCWKPGAEGLRPIF